MIYLGLLLTCLFGWLLLPSKITIATVPKVGFAFAAGAAAISVQMFAYDLAGLGWSRLSLLLPWGIAAGYVLYRRRERVRAPRWPSPTWWQVGLLGCLLVPFLVWLPFERVMPLTSQSWDAWAIWLFKAKAFYLDGGIDPYLSRGAEFANHPGYPLLVPLYGAFLYVMNGAVADQTAKLMSPCFFVAILGVFYHFARRYGAASAALVFTLMAATVPVLGVTAFLLAGYADTPLSLYCLAAAGFLYAWYQEEQAVDLAAATLAATVAAWTKNEGQFFLLGVVLLAGARLIRQPMSVRAWAVLLLPPVLVLAPWFLVRQAYGIEAAGFTLGVSFQPELFQLSARTLAAKARQPDLFNLAFYLLLGSMVAAFALRVRKAFWILPGLAAWQGAGALLAYATGRNDIDWWLQTSADRILAQIAPLALLPPALVFSEWMSRAETAPSSASGKPESATSKTRKSSQPRKPRTERR